MIGNRSDAPYLKREERRGPPAERPLKAIVPRAGLFIHVAGALPIQPTQIVKEHEPPMRPNATILSRIPEKRFSAEGVKLGGCGKMGFDTQTAINHELTTTS
jgi:hypothetical protein